MNQPRILLWVGLLLLVYLNVNAWLKDYAPNVRETPATESKPTSPGTSPADGLSTELPSVTSDAPPVSAATDIPVPEAAAGSPAAPGKVRIVTDVLDIDLSLAGGELIRADLTRYPLHKDDPSTPVRLFNTDSKDTQFVFQSGLTGGKAGRNEPNHMAQFTTGAAEYRLAPGSETLEIPFVVVGRRRSRGNEDICFPPWILSGGTALPRRQQRARCRQGLPRIHRFAATRRATNVRCGTRRHTRSADPPISTAKNTGTLEIDDEDERSFSTSRHERLDCGAATPLRRSHRSAKGTVVPIRVARQ